MEEGGLVAGLIVGKTTSLHLACGIVINLSLKKLGRVDQQKGGGGSWDPCIGGRSCPCASPLSK